MKLKAHREDVGWLRSHGILSMEKQEEIAARYQRLILAFECGKPGKEGGVTMLPWNERVTSFQINPESATIQDIVRMAEELVLIRGGGGKPSLAVDGFTGTHPLGEAVRELPLKPPRP